MLQAHPSVLADLVERYESLHAKTGSAAVDPALRRQLDDVTYTLCVITGTRSLEQALASARRRARTVRDVRDVRDVRGQASTAVPSSSTKASSSHSLTTPTTAMAG
ncbi:MULTISPECIES: DUF5133 domain-containing protein [unclassified Streptomyces]|uniref:DUF5133 domain-containing protein n=1 Tax=unclassified Streptomyces TaxID=2593676 RepID=UPI001368318D|nr:MULTISPECIES: DUF5133 domain-containing protein [unclassified Streptomyces]NEA03799.1 DUF5133 domain-containing protein [Streptomyces sp. SID10116]MYY82156.1 DUF5133 domain-containing protein [Streptomyces sp. SID335]MYZ17503.1 DUF5133 domain-containing protein [Streptomyces sp. SID337]NDZ85722.1 DUF5133 domain-containing protein [Streptomyces sp. SID10115]NEB46701.1 DUF5133 domain-containing protein [Streptomyces sp. SID339]